MFLLFLITSLSAFCFRNSISKLIDLYKAERQFEPSIILSIKNTISTLFKIYFNNNNSVEIVDNKHIIITYMFRNKTYKILVRTKKGPDLISFITNENNIDVSKEVKPFLGPYNDWHTNHKFKPSFWGYKELKFFYNNTEYVSTFQENEIITI